MKRGSAAPSNGPPAKRSRPSESVQKLFLGNLPFDAIPSEVADVLSLTAGTVNPLSPDNVKLLAPSSRAPPNSTCNGCAVVDLPSDKADADRLLALTSQSKSGAVKFQGRSIRVELQTHRAERVTRDAPSALAHSAFIANLPFHTTEGELRTVLQTFLDAYIAFQAAQETVHDSLLHTHAKESRDGTADGPGHGSGGSAAAHQRRRRLATRAATEATALVDASDQKVTPNPRRSHARINVLTVRMLRSGDADDDGNGCAVVELSSDAGVSAIVAASQRLRVGRRAIRTDWSVPKELRGADRQVLGAKPAARAGARTDRAAAPSAPTKPDSGPQAVLVSGLSADTNGAAIRAAFSMYGDVSKVAWAGAATGGSRSAIVLYAEGAAADKALGARTVAVGGSRARVTRAVVV